jgi:hypothetical protein
VFDANVVDDDFCATPNGEDIIENRHLLSSIEIDAAIWETNSLRRLNSTWQQFRTVFSLDDSSSCESYFESCQGEAVDHNKTASSSKQFIFDKGL